jgi:hypothetical protein
MIIFEYRLPLVSPAKPQDWARDWHSLADLDPNSHDFVLALEGLTRGFTHRATAPSKQVRLAQIRTSEAAFHPDREFREYRFSNGTFKLSPLPLTPDPAFTKKNSREQEALGTFLNGQALSHSIRTAPFAREREGSERRHVINELAGRDSGGGTRFSLGPGSKRLPRGAPHHVSKYVQWMPRG